MADAQLASEPTARNSKRLPGKQKEKYGYDLVLSISNSGICGISNFNPLFAA